MLKREAKLGANINHKGLASVYDLGHHGNKSFVLFEYVEGETLRKLLQHRRVIIAYEMLTGRKAFFDTDAIRLLRKPIEQLPPRHDEVFSEIPVSAERAIFRALSKKPDDRFQTCREFAAALGDERQPTSQRHTVPTATQDRLAFYLCHVA